MHLYTILRRSRSKHNECAEKSMYSCLIEESTGRILAYFPGPKQEQSVVAMIQGYHRNARKQHHQCTDATCTECDTIQHVNDTPANSPKNVDRYIIDCLEQFLNEKDLRGQNGLCAYIYYSTEDTYLAEQALAVFQRHLSKYLQDFPSSLANDWGYLAPCGLVDERRIEAAIWIKNRILTATPTL